MLRADIKNIQVRLFYSMTTAVLYKVDLLSSPPPAPVQSPPPTTPGPPAPACQCPPPPPPTGTSRCSRPGPASRYIGTSNTSYSTCECELISVCDIVEYILDYCPLLCRVIFGLMCWSEGEHSEHSAGGKATDHCLARWAEIASHLYFWLIHEIYIKFV